LAKKRNQKKMFHPSANEDKIHSSNLEETTISGNGNRWTFLLPRVPRCQLVPLLVFLAIVVSRALAGQEDKPGKPVRAKKREASGTKSGTTKSFENTLGMTMVRIRAGTFKMGSTKAEQHAVMKSADKKFRKYVREWLDTEGPQHEVKVTHAFYMAAHPVTRGQFAQFVAETGYKTDAERDGEGGWGYNAKRKRHEGRKPFYTWRKWGWSQTNRHPVVNVSWNDAVAFCKWLSKKEGKTYRLPTEAQWEYACRAGTTTRYCSGDTEADLRDHANLADQSLLRKFDAKAYSDYGFMDWDDGYPFTAPVGRFKPNGWGLYDMHGNVCQWCRDCFDKDYYQHSPKEDPECTRGDWRVLRGGSWYLDARFCRAANRYPSLPADRGIWVGFRVILEPAGRTP
jgi:formylglycine-generating enzyme required for sulfatase activity